MPTRHVSDMATTCDFCSSIKGGMCSTFLGYLCTDCLDRLRNTLKGMVNAYRIVDVTTGSGTATPNRCEHGALMPECLDMRCAHYRGAL